MSFFSLQLALDLSSSRSSAAIHRQQADESLVLLGEHFIEGQGRQSEALLNSIDTLLKTCGVQLSEIDLYVTPSGPGSFMGLRIAYSALKAWCAAFQKPLVTVGAHEVRALDFVAHTLSPQSFAKPITIATQLTKELYLVSEYTLDGGALVLLKEQTLASLPENILPGCAAELSARKLNEHWHQAQTARLLRRPEEITGAAPEYFGSKFG